MTLQIYHGDNLPLLKSFQPIFNLIYIDPPFNTGKTQTRTQLTTQSVQAAPDGDRIGFGGKLYKTIKLGTKSYQDAFGDEYLAFLEPRLEEAHRVLVSNGALFVHLDYREVHYVKVLLDSIFGRECFLNEIIWAYDYGARSKSRWSAKHDNILVYVKDPKDYIFNYDEIDRIPYMAPALVGEEKAEKGKTVTSCWWHTIVPTNGKEKTGYPTQKPLGILNRIVKVHSRPGDMLLDFFAGSGSFGEAAVRQGRHCVLIDENEEAIEVMARRLKEFGPEVVLA